MRKKTLLTLVFLSLAIATALAANKFTLVIDAGHGGHDSGAPGAISKEKDINLKVALAFGKMVERNCHDVKVIYTRTTDVFIPLSERANIANRNKADLFISVHTNALDGGKISRGFETYTLGMHRANDNLNVAKRENSVILIEKDYKQRYAGFDPKSSESYIMFELMQDKNIAKSVDLAKLIQSEVCAVSGRVNKGVHQAGFLVLRETSMPSCLIELGFITTPDEEQFLNSADGQNLMAKGIYNAFLKYKKQHGSTKIAADGASDASDNAPVLAQQTFFCYSEGTFHPKAFFHHGIFFIYSASRGYSSVCGRRYNFCNTICGTTKRKEVAHYFHRFTSSRHTGSPAACNYRCGSAPRHTGSPAACNYRCGSTPCHTGFPAACNYRCGSAPRHTGSPAAYDYRYGSTPRYTGSPAACNYRYGSTPRYTGSPANSFTLF